MDATKPICHHVADILHHAQVQNPNLELDYSDTIFNQALIIIDYKIKALGGSELKTFGLPDPQQHNDNELTNEILRETNDNMEQLAEYIQENEPCLVPD